jgi:hypothetical protein
LVVVKVRLLESIEIIYQPSRQLRKLADKIVNSSTKLLPAWKKLLVDLKMPEKLMPRDMKMRWNSTFVMLDFAVVYRKPLDALSGERNNELREYKLKEEDWKIAVQLHNVLKVSVTVTSVTYWIFPQVFQDAMSFFSRGSPNLVTVIPAMDHIDEVLTSQSINTSYYAPVRAALAMGKKTLNHYYNLTDSSKVYHIVMGSSHPCFFL